MARASQFDLTGAINCRINLGKDSLGAFREKFTMQWMWRQVFGRILKLIRMSFARGFGAGG